MEEPSGKNELALGDSNVEKGVRTAFLSEGGGSFSFSFFSSSAESMTGISGD